MISVIIPTMCRCPQVTSKLLQSLLEDLTIGEIILINNAQKQIITNNERIRVINPSNNLYVNPSWNLGFKESKFEYIALVNDDLLLCNNFFSKLLIQYQKQTNPGIVGADIKHILTSYNINDYESIPDEKDINLLPVGERTYAFGILMFGRKTSFKTVPELLKVWCGDDFMVKYNIDNHRQNYVAQGPIIKHIESLTSNDPVFDAIKKADLEYYKTLDKNFWYK